MDVALDANILIADPWLRSQNMRALLDFARKTQSRIILQEVVETEVKAHVKRQLSGAIKTIESALKTGLRYEIVVPEFQADHSLQATWEKWENNFAQTLSEDLVLRLPMVNSIFAEAVRRAAERLPPCSESGDGLRDTIIWLSLLEFCTRQRKGVATAFISANTRDFAAQDKTTLRSELMQDTEHYESNVLYYSSLDSFLQEHAQPIAHITMDWIKEYLTTGVVEVFIGNYLDSWRSRSLYSAREGYFKISDDTYRKYYLPMEKPEVTSVIANFIDFYAWKFDDQHVEIRLILDADVEADIECELIEKPYRPSLGRQYSIFFDDDDEDEDEYPRRRTLSCFAELTYEIAAEISGNTISLLNTEEVYSR